MCIYTYTVYTLFYIVSYNIIHREQLLTLPHILSLSLSLANLDGPPVE